MTLQVEVFTSELRCAIINKEVIKMLFLLDLDYIQKKIEIINNFNLSHEDQQHFEKIIKAFNKNKSEYTQGFNNKIQNIKIELDGIIKKYS